MVEFIICNVCLLSVFVLSLLVKDSIPFFISFFFFLSNDYAYDADDDDDDDDAD